MNSFNVMGTSRELRVDYAGASHHVMYRGAYLEPITKANRQRL